VLQNTRPNVNAPYTYDTIGARAKGVLTMTAEAGTETASLVTEPVAYAAAMEATALIVQHSGNFADGHDVISSASAVSGSITEGGQP
jgi:hypothetical protein